MVACVIMGVIMDAFVIIDVIMDVIMDVLMDVIMVLQWCCNEIKRHPVYPYNMCHNGVIMESGFADAFLHLESVEVGYTWHISEMYQGVRHSRHIPDI
jgi:hypothetical protein